MSIISLVIFESALALDVTLTDPTRPAKISRVENTAAQQTFQGDHTLSQIYISKQNRLAIINGKKVKVGDWADGAKVVSIKLNSVLLMVDGAKKQLSISPSFKNYSQK